MIRPSSYGSSQLLRCVDVAWAWKNTLNDRTNSNASKLVEQIKTKERIVLKELGKITL